MVGPEGFEPSTTGTLRDPSVNAKHVFGLTSHIRPALYQVELWARYK